MNGENALASTSKHDSTLHKQSEKSHKRKKDKHHSKHTNNQGEVEGKKHKSKDREGKVKGKDKEKRKRRDEKSPFEYRLSQMRLSIPPKFSGEWMVGVREVLDGMIMRYVAQLDGVLLAHWEHSFLDDSLKLVNECPYGVCEVQFHAIVWSPRIGQKLYGSYSLSSPSHLSLLCSKTFNVSIPLQHIPQDDYQFEHTAPEDLADQESSDEEDSDAEGWNTLNGNTVHEVGRWRHKKSGKLVGEGGKGIKFTVIGMQVTNQMLSLTGSLLADPTNPPPPPSPAPIALPPSPSPEPEIPEPAPKKAKTSKPRQPAISNGHDTPVSASAPAVEVEAPVDERFLSARELKQKRKAEERAKRDARKSKQAHDKEAGAIQDVHEMGGWMSVDMSEDQAVRDLEGPKESNKRKASAERDGGKRKKGKV